MYIHCRNEALRLRTYREKFTQGKARNIKINSRQKGERKVDCSLANNKDHPEEHRRRNKYTISIARIIGGTLLKTVTRNPRTI